MIQKSFGEPVRFGGLTVCIGDYVIADRYGVVATPAGRIAEVLEIAERLMKRKAAMIAGFRQGRSVVEVMHDTQFQAVMEPSENR
ncbi:hypothetical protein FNJ84_15085 [Paracoccus sp. M683]|nr:hypothetical protein FNJ84_15085 [Paracoccus sp. M683]